jgi:hypothetical protein
MRFLITWKINGGAEADQARILGLFAAWEPPIELHEWSGFADGAGGMAIAEADDAAMIARVTTPWTPWLDFTIQAILPIEQTAGVLSEALEFRSSVA